jgi:hypothetical protein
MVDGLAPEILSKVVDGGSGGAIRNEYSILECLSF